MRMALFGNISINPSNVTHIEGSSGSAFGETKVFLVGRSVPLSVPGDLQAVTSKLSEAMKG